MSIRMIVEQFVASSPISQVKGYTVSFCEDQISLIIKHARLCGLDTSSKLLYKDKIQTSICLFSLGFIVLHEARSDSTVACFKSTRGQPIFKEYCTICPTHSMKLDHVSKLFHVIVFIFSYMLLHWLRLFSPLGT